MTQQTFSIRLANVLYNSDLLNKERLPKEILLGRIESIIEYALSAYREEQAGTTKMSFTEKTYKKPDACEKCGLEVGQKMIGDELYRNCPDCGTGIEQ